jgi:hypothetical protein
MSLIQLVWSPAASRIAWSWELSATEEKAPINMLYHVKKRFSYYNNIRNNCYRNRNKNDNYNNDGGRD